MYEEEDDGNVFCGGSSVGWYSQSDSVGRRLGGSRGETGSIMTAMEIKSTTIGKRERMGSGVIWTETGPWRSTPGWTENTM